MKDNLRIEMEKRIRNESEISTFKETSSSKIDGLDSKWEKMLEKYRACKQENKSLKTKNEQLLLKQGESDKLHSNFREQILELKERNRLLIQKLDIYES
jgi:hypothetical protein